MLKKALPSIMIPAFVGVWFVACALDENGTSAGSTSSSSSSANSTSSGMGGELFTVSSSSSSSGMGGMGGAGGGSSSSSSGIVKGQPCGTQSDCFTGLTCDDGVCCEKTCAPCFSCNQTGKEGTCVSLPEGANDCPTKGHLCSVLAQCECGVSQPVVSDTPCPLDTVAPSRWSGANGTCTFLCDGMDDCKNEGTITCAEGSDCVIDCTGNGGCEGTTFVCPPARSCTLKCSNTDSCKNTTLICSDDGPCNVECSVSMSCGGSNVDCGNNACVGTCAGGSGKPTFAQKMGTQSCGSKPCP